MIRFSKNDKKIFGDNRYNILEGFSVWCVLTFLFALIMLGLLVVILRSELPNEYHIPITIYIGIGILIWSSIRFIIAGVNIANRSKSAIKSINKATHTLMMSSLFWVLAFFLSFGWVIGAFGFFAAVFVAQILYFFYCIKLTFDYNSVKVYFGYKDSGFGAREREKSKTVEMFDDWDPIIGYGQFLSRISTFFIFILFVIAHMKLHYEVFEKMPISIFFMSPVIIFQMYIGKQLVKKTKYGVKLTVLYHLFLFLLPIILPILLSPLIVFVSQNVAPESNFGKSFLANMILINIILIPMLHWCYFVIRSLNSHVVQINCK